MSRFIAHEYYSAPPLASQWFLSNERRSVAPRRDAGTFADMWVRARGFTALETTIAAGLMAMLFAAVGTGLVREGAAFQSALTADALGAAAHEEVRIAADALKYEGSSLQPSSIATTLPMPAGSPIPARLTLSLATLPGGVLAIRVRADSSVGSGTLGREATLVVERRMPIPGSSITAATRVAAPFGAP